MSTAAIVILLHQLLFQGAFVAKNVTLARRLGKPIRGNNPEAQWAVLFLAAFIALSLALALTGNPGGVRLLPQGLALGLCLLLLAGNLVIGLAALRDLGDSWRVGVIEEQRTELVESGIYRHTRNPYFVAYLLMAAAYTLLLQNPWLLLLCAIGFIVIHRMILREERHLDSLHGEAYRAYSRRVPRYLLR